MDMQQMLDLISAQGELERHKGGQKTLGYLQDMLKNLPQEMPCKFDTGHNFGLDSVVYEEEEPFESDWYSHGGYSVATSDTAHPSSYRGYYSDCTFNCCPYYEESTVGHVLSLVEGAIGRSFDGYKGGVNLFTEGTLVWGGGTSHCCTGDNRKLIGIKVIDGVCVLETEEEEW